MTMKNFVVESWKIEGLDLDDDTLVEYHTKWIERNEVTVASLSSAALEFTNGRGKIRDKFGMNVMVGNYYPISGGSKVVYLLEKLCTDALSLHPHELHKQFEELHPFMDGNGRVGRLLWAWAMPNSDWMRIGFLHTWYYQSLELG